MRSITDCILPLGLCIRGGQISHKTKHKMTKFLHKSKHKLAEFCNKSKHHAFSFFGKYRFQNIAISTKPAVIATSAML